MKVLVFGGRYYDNWPKVMDALDALHSRHPITQIVHGGASGADTLAGKWARINNIPAQVFPAQWSQYGRSAGPIRNTEMAKAGAAMGVEFPGGYGTLDMRRKLIQRTIPVWRPLVDLHMSAPLGAP